MSGSTPPLSDRGPPAERQSARSRRWLLEPVRGVAFWAAIALPFVQLPLLVSGLQQPSTAAAFLALLALNVFTLYVGHAYQRE
ncbi:hypothetical protein Hrd1104_00285 [Halorhabdus sp. CBA1104]|uniref:hypothetical protein n=1 Tax=unclassified Halorhabdus TaxID=2621901 RepID=UPI0012B2821B|nr:MULTISPECIES: hypothetical protein [unclassified Halorhabdus]QGN05880.1 hypothetical protein Hrd1104_00285 [Halorhabdus sp. CBA1104]